MVHVILIFLLFALIHSITASKKFKLRCRDFFGATFMRAFYRALYTMVSCITAGVAFSFIRRVPDQQLWIAPAWLRWTMHLIQGAALAFGSLSFEYLDTGEFMGFRQVLRYFMRREEAGNIEGLTQKELVITGVYGIVRHPLYLAGIIIVTFNPHVTVNSLAVSVLADLYFLFGVSIEERRMLTIFGDQYREYQGRVPRLLPDFFRWKVRKHGIL